MILAIKMVSPLPIVFLGYDEDMVSSLCPMNCGKTSQNERPHDESSSHYVRLATY